MQLSPLLFCGGGLSIPRARPPVVPIRIPSLYLQALHRLSPPTLLAAHHLSSAFPPSLRATGTEELSWTAQKVTWRIGGSIHRSFTFPEQNQSIVQALFCWFQVPQESSERSTSNLNDTSSGETFGPFQRTPPPAWTDDPLPLPTNPTLPLPAPKMRLERSLVIFLQDIAFVFPLEREGGSYPLQLPFHLKRAWAMEVGILLERAAEGEERIGKEAGMPTLYSLLESTDEIKVVSFSSRLEGLFEGMEGERKARARAATSPIQDLGERIVLVSDLRDGSEPVVVTVNRERGKVAVWSYARVQVDVEGSGEAVDEGDPERMEDVVQANVKGKGRAMDQSGEISIAIINPSTSSKRKRTSFVYGNVSTTLDRSQRRTSASGLGSTSLPHAVGALNNEESDLLEVLGPSMGSAMKRTPSIINAMSAAERRGSVTRNELSITLDRMALSGGAGPAMMGAAAGEMDREATLFDVEVEESRMVSDVMVEKIWEIDLGHAGSDIFDDLMAHMFDSRSSSTSSLAIVLPSTSTLLLLTLARIEQGRISVTPLLQVSAIAATPVLASRGNVLDLLFLTPDQEWRVVSAGGRIETVRSPKLPEGRRAVKLEGDGSALVRISLDDGSTFSSTLPPPPGGLALECLHALSLALSVESFHQLQTAMTARRVESARSTHFEALVDVLGLQGTPAPLASDATAWAAFLRHSDEDPLFAALRSSSSSRPSLATPPPRVPMVQLSQRQRETVLLALHLLAEDLKLQSGRMGDCLIMLAVVKSLAAGLGLRHWVDEYRRVTGGADDLNEMASPLADSSLPLGPINIGRILAATLLSPNDVSHPHTPAFHARYHYGHSNFYGDVASTSYSTTRGLLSLYSLLALSVPDSTSSSRARSAVLQMHALGWTRETLRRLAVGVAVPLWEAIRLCQLEAPEGWPVPAYELIRRNDLARQVGGARPSGLEIRLPAASTIEAATAGIAVNSIGADQRSLRHSKAARFGEDRRLEEVDRMLQYSAPVTINGGDRSIEQLTPTVQQGILMSLSNRTLSLPIGFAMFSFRSRTSAPTETVEIASINLSARILPMPSVVAFVEKERVDASGTSTKERERLEWPEFHSGVAAALELGADGLDFDSSQISFNRPATLNSKHAGFLMGLGLAGHISQMVFNQAFEYLKMKHDPTSIGLLLGLATTYLGTGDPKVTSLLSVHLAALHPPNSSTLNVSGITQAAGLVGIGLLYLGTEKRTLADVMVRELCAVKVTTVEDPSACREAYALSAGFAFGFIMLGKGAETTTSLRTATGGGGVMGLLRTFRALILGETVHTLPGNRPAPQTDINITSPAATIALSLMFLKTSRQDVADILALPDSLRKLDYVRSDLLLLRTLGRSLIMWEATSSSKEWIDSHLPEFIVQGLESNPTDGELDIARWNIIAGACFGLGLKFAGTARKEAHITLIHYLDRLTRAAYAKATTVQSKIRRHAIRSCLSVVAMSLVMVMAGTGELNVLRRLRIAHGHFSEGVTYGTHLSSHMALGLLFLGSGRYTLGTSNAAIAALVLAFYPSYPSTPSENRAHLQAFRHLWTIAVEPRCLIARDVDTNEPSFLPIRLRLKEKGGTSARALELVAPTLIPELRLIDTIQIDSPRYWNFVLHLSSNPRHLADFLASGTLFVKRRTGHLSYSQDPRGNRSIFTRSKSETGSAVFDLGEISKDLAPSEGGLKDFVTSFSGDEESIAAVTFLCPQVDDAGGPTEFEAFSASVLLECLTKDKPDTIPLYRTLFTTVRQLLDSNSNSSIAGLEQLCLLIDFYRSGHFDLLFQGTAKSSSVRETLIQRNLMDHIQRKTREFAQTTLEREGTVILESYLARSTWPSIPSAGRALSIYLLVHSAPPLSVLEQLRELVRASRAQGGKGEEIRDTVLLLMRTVARRVDLAGQRSWSDEFGKKLVEVCLAQ